MVADRIYFGKDYHQAFDGFMFSFGCVSRETNLFYEQAADGILGMGMSSGLGVKTQVPIYEAMMKSGIISKNMFNICLGKDGGYFQIGGYNTDYLLSETRWFNFQNKYGTNYKFSISGVSLNNHYIDGSEKWNTGFIDSGTTFTYLPPEMWN